MCEKKSSLVRKMFSFFFFFAFLPSATVVAERLCFHRCLSVHRGEVYTPWQTDPPPSGSWTDTAAPRETPPLCRQPPPPDGYCSERYASLWNAFLLSFNSASLQEAIAGYTNICLLFEYDIQWGLFFVAWRRL